MYWTDYSSPTISRIRTPTRKNKHLQEPDVIWEPEYRSGYIAYLTGKNSLSFCVLLFNPRIMIAAAVVVVVVVNYCYQYPPTMVLHWLMCITTATHCVSSSTNTIATNPTTTPITTSLTTNIITTSSTYLPSPPSFSPYPPLTPRNRGGGAREAEWDSSLSIGLQSLPENLFGARRGLLRMPRGSG